MRSLARQMISVDRRTPGGLGRTRARPTRWSHPRSCPKACEHSRERGLPAYCSAQDTRRKHCLGDASRAAPLGRVRWPTFRICVRNKASHGRVCERKVIPLPSALTAAGPVSTHTAGGVFLLPKFTHVNETRVWVRKPLADSGPSAARHAQKLTPPADPT